MRGRLGSMRQIKALSSRGWSRILLSPGCLPLTLTTTQPAFPSILRRSTVIPRDLLVERCLHGWSFNFSIEERAELARMVSGVELRVGVGRFSRGGTDLPSALHTEP